MLGFLAYSSSPRWFPELVSRERGFFALVVAVWFSAPGDGACVVEFEQVVVLCQLVFLLDGPAWSPARDFCCALLFPCNSITIGNVV